MMTMNKQMKSVAIVACRTGKSQEFRIGQAGAAVWVTGCSVILLL